ncbi:hypothetical protein BRW62_08335 [Parathermosynechococcus lividus PCC 6715]|uniref:Chromosome partition protein Smc n=1 Tax=Parathermosynechococcus lividus PCC 6715 TaxID=1917166 RepID=A0A2D2Q2P1_PARLV|nr:hypothetical protein [Thermostichus lividus]pir/S36980/ hypothetical protein 6 (atpC 5' region) - Synechococcus sp. (PCC 6716) [Synechococcus sp.]ATS18756.1 hypothetical protein BRW62_08335 [Thermostichus lividus PCC 6715]CAA49890.1 unnamed protein product [Synechococcus sp.]
MPSPENPSNPPDDLLETIITDLGELARTASQPEEVDLSSLAAELESLTSSAEQRAIAQNADLQEQISQLTTELTTLQTERDHLNRELSDLRANYQRATAEVQRLQEQLASQQATHASDLLKEQVARLTAEKTALEGMRQNLEQELAQAITQQEELQQQLLTLQDQATTLAELNAQLTSLQTEKAALEQQLQDALAAAPPDSLEETALLNEPHDIGLAQQLAQLTRQLTQVETERNTLNAELEQIKLEADALRHDNEALRAQVSTVVPTELTLAAQENRHLKRQLRRQGYALWLTGIAATVISALSVSLTLPQPVGRVVPPLAALAVPILTVLARGRSPEIAPTETPT